MWPIFYQSGAHTAGEEVTDNKLCSLSLHSIAIRIARSSARGQQFHYIGDELLE